MFINLVSRGKSIESSVCWSVFEVNKKLVYILAEISGLVAYSLKPIFALKP